MEPTPYTAPLPPPPQGKWYWRPFVALFWERRIPYQLDTMLDRACLAIGRQQKSITVNGCRLRIRRGTSDFHFAQNMLIHEEYLGDGYEIQPTDTVIDIGGNIGTFSLSASRYASEGRVFAFEPAPENYELFQTNLELNHRRNVIVENVAVSNTCGEATFFLCPDQPGNHSLVEERAVGEVQQEVIRCVTLQSIFDDHQIDRCHFLKLDCEGAEYDILYSLPLDYFERIDRIVMEYHGERNGEGRIAAADELVQFLQSVGYQIDTYLDFVGFNCGQIRATRRDL